jgi:hypothetical protein
LCYRAGIVLVDDGGEAIAMVKGVNQSVSRGAKEIAEEISRWQDSAD